MILVDLTMIVVPELVTEFFPRIQTGAFCNYSFSRFDLPKNVVKYCCFKFDLPESLVNYSYI